MERSVAIIGFGVFVGLPVFYGLVLMRFSRDLSLDIQVQQKYGYKRDRLLYQYPKNNEYMKYYDKNNVD